MSDVVRKRNLLLYHDKCFQTDMYFLMIAFNHKQIKGASTSSKAFVKRSNFADVSRRLRRINPEVAGNIADWLAEGEYVKPQTEQEKDCFDLMHDLDGIGAHVPGAATSKHHQRNQIWSKTAFMGAPSRFVTMAWNNNSHPLALYYAQEDMVFRPTHMASSFGYPNEPHI
ncbi:hypothetical protein B0H10DRAFT_1804384 [Mycena sp. CBHHK59/15]|nr:hypothetical protein B0H10DRAFT_1809750 [Mycena sp. CBHHK59/15]KAJ6614036.1 hypothetical protein B0H10DRAFT_1804384 [Mycena sp. CBHHK59/15]